MNEQSYDQIPLLFLSWEGPRGLIRDSLSGLAHSVSETRTDWRRTRLWPSVFQWSCPRANIKDKMATQFSAWQAKKGSEHFRACGVKHTNHWRKRKWWGIMGKTSRCLTRWPRGTCEDTDVRSDLIPKHQRLPTVCICVDLPVGVQVGTRGSQVFSENDHQAERWAIRTDWFLICISKSIG